MTQKNQPINFKSEAWKYTPPKAFDISEFKLKSYDQNNYSWGLGPSEDQFQTIFFNDLLDDGTISLGSPVILPKSDKIDRALIDDVLSTHIGSATEEAIVFKNSLPTTAWLNTNMAPTLSSTTLEDGVKQSLCLFESSQPEGLSQNFKIHLKKDSTLNLGIHLNSEFKTYRQINFVLEENANLNFFSLMSGSSSYKRLEVRVYLCGENTNATVNGLSLTKTDSVFDFHSDIVHLDTAQETTQMYRSLNQENGHSIFSGRIHLTEDSSEAQVEQLNNNLLLSKKSKVDTQPELNIYQDNVKASHGATTGSLDEDHFFYFRSRGFKHEQAKKMLLQSFCVEPLNCLEDPGLKNYFINRVTEEL